MEGKLFHDLRHSDVRNMTRRESRNQQLCGSAAIRRGAYSDRYNITSEEYLKTAADKVTRYQNMMREMLERKQREVTGTGKSF